MESETLSFLHDISSPEELDSDKENVPKNGCTHLQVIIPTTDLMTTILSGQKPESDS